MEGSRDGVTSGLTVVEIGQGIAPSYCAKLLADYGSNVVKVELPEGDRLRAAGPFRNDEPSSEGAGLFAFLNTSKKSVTVDWRTEEGARLVGALIEPADVVVHSLVGEARAGLGLGPDGPDRPGLVEVAVTPYGLDGPYAGLERESITLAALSGWMFCMGDHDKPPLFPGGPYVEYISGISAAVGALIAIEARADTGLGQVVDVSEFEVGVGALAFDPARFSYSGIYRDRTDELYAGSTMAAVYPCADGYIQFQEIRRARELLAMVGGEELAGDERFETEEQRLAHRDELRQAFVDHLADKSRWDVFDQWGRAHFVVSAVPDMADVLALEPHRERSYFQPVAAGPLQGVPLPGPPIRFGEGAWRANPAPALGVDNREVLTGTPGPTPERVADRPAAPPHLTGEPATALGGLRVVEIAQGWAGPLVGAMLADFGADVIKVESTRRLDWWRGTAVDDEDQWLHERSALFNGINRNKRDVTLDLQDPKGRALLLDLVGQADIFVENFTAHVVEKLQLTHDELSAANPGLISVSMPAYGSDSAWRDFPALGTTVESMCGVQSVTGYEGGPPRMQGTSWDPVIGLYASFAVLAAVHHRRRTGRGQHIEVSHIEAGTHLVAGPLLEYLVAGRMPARVGNTSAVHAPHGCYPAKGSDQWITLVARSDAEWEALVGVLGDDPSLRRPEFATVEGRLAGRAVLDEAIGALTKQRDARALFGELQAAAVPAAPVATPPDLLQDPHLAARDFWAWADRPYVGTHPYPSRFLTMSRTPPNYSRAAPTLGQDNEFVLSTRLGLSAESIAELERSGVIGTVPVRPA